MNRLHSIAWLASARNVQLRLQTWDITGRPTRIGAIESLDLGTALVCDGHRTLDTIGIAVAIRRAFPWQPLVLIADTADEVTCSAIASTWRDEGTAVTVLGRPVVNERGLVQACAGALEGLPTPSNEQFAAYILDRTNDRNLAEGLSAVLSIGQSTTSRYRVYRQLRSTGPLGAASWHGLAALARVASQSCSVRGRSLEWLARECHTEPRRLELWSKRLLGMRAQQLLQRIGWHWVPELAMRRAGYSLLQTGA